MSGANMNDSREVSERGAMILEAIDALRGRKARPDESRICQWLERRYGLSKDQILGDIKHSVSNGLVLKVKYKDSISYRNPAKFNRIAFDELKPNLPLNATKRVLRTIRQLTLNKCASSQTKGASMCRIMNSLHSNKQMLSYDEIHLERILKRAMQAGTVDQLPNGCYVLASAKSNISKKRKSCATPATASSNSNDSCDVENAHNSESSKNVTRKKASQSSVKRSRPVSTRKKFKKSLGPDFLEPSDLGLQYLQDTFEPKCDDCQSTDIDSDAAIEGDENGDITEDQRTVDFAKEDAKDNLTKDRRDMIVKAIRQISDNTSFPADSFESEKATPSPREWTVEDVYTFVGFIGFPEQANAFKEQCIDGVSLLLLTRMDVLTGLSMKLGPALKIYGHIKKLQYFYSQQE